MKQNQPVKLSLPGAGSFAVGPAASKVVACAPVNVAPPPGATFRPLQIGALLVGAAGEVSPALASGLTTLASAAGPALLTIGLARVKHLGHLMALRDHDAAYVGAEEEMQDLPMEIVRPPTGYGMEDPTQPLLVKDKVRNSNESPTTRTTEAPSNLERVSSAHEADLPVGNGQAEPAGKVLPPAQYADPVKPGKAKIDNIAEGGKFFRESASERSLSAPLTPLFTFADPASEATYAVAKAQANVLADAAIAALHMVAILTMMWMSLGSAQPQVWAALLLSALLPLGSALVALRGNAPWYARAREVLLVLLMETHLAVARRASLHVGAEPSGMLPCLLRTPDMVLALVLPIGLRLRLVWLAPLQLVNLCAVVARMPWATLHACGCSYACMAFMGLCGAVLPLGIAHAMEAKERRAIQASRALACSHA